MAAQFNAEHMYTYLKGYAMGKNWPNVVNALAFAREMHKDQKRKDGQPYLVHPLVMASHALTLGLDREDIIAACLLHDVVEDCNVNTESLPVSNDIKDIVQRVTHVKGMPMSVYYDEMAQSEPAMLVKLLDRCDNVSTMAGVFTLSKTLDYVQETREYVLPLIRKVKNAFPTDSDVLFALKYQITAVIDSISAAIEATMAVNHSQSPT